MVLPNSIFKVALSTYFIIQVTKRHVLTILSLFKWHMLIIYKTKLCTLAHSWSLNTFYHKENTYTNIPTH